MQIVTQMSDTISNAQVTFGLVQLTRTRARFHFYSAKNRIRKKLENISLWCWCKCFVWRILQGGKKVLKQNKQHTETLTSFQKSAPLINKAERGRLKRLPAASWSPLHSPHLSCLPPAGLVPHVPGRGNAPGTWIWRDVSTPPWGQESRAPPQRSTAGIHALEVWHHGRTVQAGRKSGIVPRDECVCVGPTSVCQV